MKKMFLFLSGVGIGVFLTFSYAYVKKNYLMPNQEMTFFEEPKGCISYQKLKIFQVIEADFALAHELNRGKMGIVVALTNYEGTPYFDDEIITLKQKKCFKQVGTYKYLTRDKSYKTIPIVAIEE